MGEQENQEAVRILKTRVSDALRKDGLEPGRMDVSGLRDGFCRLSIELIIPEQDEPADELEMGPLTMERIALIIADVLDYRLIPGQVKCGKIAKALRAAAKR